MTDDTKTSDLSQRIAEAMARTSEPRPTGDGPMNDGSEIIGSVPMHLRHLHNLLDELGHEVADAAQAFHAKKKQHETVRTLFFDALKTQVPEPQKSTGISILANWDVAAMFRDSDDGGEMEGLSAAALVQAMMGRVR